ncbi:MAG: hypothetical protein H0W16_13735 [Actinobacteria bacterium]|nr:hypothetical protein [Actinomycetota bacterium]
MTERRAARLGLAGALALVLAQLGVGSAWSLTHDDPTELELTRRCLERERGFAVEETIGDAVASSASGGTVTAIVEGNLVVISVVASADEAERLRLAYGSAEGELGPRLEVRGRYVSRWRRDPSGTQRQATYDCAY